MKFRSRRIVEAVQWFPGKTIQVKCYIHETTDGYAFLDQGQKLLAFGRWYRIDPGDYVVTDADGYVRVWNRNEFERDYESIGG